MAKFLFYSDYIRFIQDLELCGELNIVADLMKDFTNHFIVDNPSIFHVFLDALWKCYPEYDLECNMKAIENFDDVYFHKYKNPTLEFVGHYLYFLADENFEQQLSIEEKSNNYSCYDFEDEAIFISNLEKIEKKNDVEPNSVSFGIKEKFSCNLEKILEELNEAPHFFADEYSPRKLTKILTSSNLKELKKEDREFNIISQTNQFVYLIDNLKGTFKATYNDQIFDKYCSIKTKNSKQLTSQNFHSVRNRNNNTPPIYAKEIEAMIRKYSPDLYKCQKA